MGKTPPRGDGLKYSREEKILKGNFVIDFNLSIGRFECDELGCIEGCRFFEGYALIH
jgi:hypothetical protein